MIAMEAKSGKLRDQKSDWMQRFSIDRIKKIIWSINEFME